MKRSKINSVIKEMEDMAARHHFPLPPFCSWTPRDWLSKNQEYDEIRDCMLGWDITDFGSGDFEKVGFALITIRNGKNNDPRYPKPYAEKLIMLKEGQICPLHYHWYKREDIINRGGGTLLLTVYNGHEDRSKDDREVLVHLDGRSFYVPAGTAVMLAPGESISIPQYQYHSFAVKEGTGSVLIGEVSMNNDDSTDNCFYDPIGRFPKIEEDQAPYRLLLNEYPAKVQK